MAATSGITIATRLIMVAAGTDTSRTHTQTGVIRPRQMPMSARQRLRRTGWTTLIRHLREHGLDDATLLASGLAARARTGNLIDTFRDRLVFPLPGADRHGRRRN